MPTWLGGGGTSRGEPAAAPTFGPEFSVHLDGSSYYHRAASANGVGSAWSVSGWFKPTGLTGTQRIFVLGTLTGANRIVVSAVGTTLRLNIAGTLGGAGITTDYSGALADDEWYHILLTKQGGGTYALYINGLAQSSPGGPVTMGNTSRAVTIGQSPSFTAGEGFVGRVGHWALWGNRVLDLFEGTDVAPWLYGEGFNVDLSVDNSPDYQASSAANLDHYWRPAFADLGFTDEGPDLGGLDLNASVGVDAGDVVHDFPFQVSAGDNTRALQIDDLAPDEVKNLSAAGNFGIADTWSVSVWAAPNFDGSSTSDVIYFGNPDLNESVIRIAFVDVGEATPGGFFAVLLFDSAGSIFKSYRYENALVPTSGTWHHWLVTWDGTNLVVYYNGALEAPTAQIIDNAGTMADAVRFVGIGGRLESGPVYIGSFNGLMGHIGVWSSELDADNAAEVYDQGFEIDLETNDGDYDRSGDLVHYWPFGREDLPAGLNDEVGALHLTDSVIITTPNPVTGAP